MAKADGRIPLLGQGHPYNPWVYVMSREAMVDPDSPFLYRVTVQYAEIENPLDQIPIIEWLSEPIGVEMTADIRSKKAITNSSGEPLDPPHVEDVQDIILRATWNVWPFNAIGAANYINAVNSDTFLEFTPGKAKVLAYSGREIKMITGYKYVEVTVEIQFREDDRKLRFVDQGFRTKTGEGTEAKYTEIMDDSTPPKRISEPVLLDGSGQKLGDGLDAVIMEYWVKKELPFSTEFSRIA